MADIETVSVSLAAEVNQLDVTVNVLIALRTDLEHEKAMIENPDATPEEIGADPATIGESSLQRCVRRLNAVTSTIAAYRKHREV